MGGLGLGAGCNFGRCSWKERPDPGATAAALLGTGASCGIGSAPPMQWTASVQGSITSRDVFLHSFTILRLWGPAFYVRCIRAIASRRSCTFLDVLAEQR